MLAQLHTASIQSKYPLVPPSKLWPSIQDRSSTLDLVQIVDGQLQSLLQCLSLALYSQKAVIALQMWQHSHYFSLLPFHLHLRWTNVIDHLPLTFRMGIAPFLKAHEALASSPLYKVKDVICAREEARRARGEKHSFLPEDFSITDWERGCNNHFEELKNRLLPGASFLRIDEVLPDGSINKGNRFLLGKLASRQLPCPTLLTPAKSGISRYSARVFAGLDLMLVNLQGLRGRRVINSVRNVLHARGFDRASLIIASSPSDLLAMGVDIFPQSVPISLIGAPPKIGEAVVLQVGQDRPIAERGFEFAIEELRGRSDLTDYLVDLAKSAWWAAKQSVNDEGDFEPEVRHFVNALDKASSNNADDVGLLNSGRELILQATADAEHARERLQAVAKAALYTKGSASTLIITRGKGVSRVRREIAALLDLPEELLAELGVNIESHISRFSGEPPDTAITAGYSGLATLDKLLMSRAKKLRLVFDPIEARAAWYGVRKLIECLDYLGVTEPVELLQRLAEQIAEGIPPQLRTAATDINLSNLWFDFSSGLPALVQGERRDQFTANEVSIYFIGGTRMHVGENARFDVLGGIGGRIKTVAATELQPGDEIVLLHEESRALFSDQLIKVIDKGVLKDAVEQRALWLMLVRVESSHNKVGVQSIVRQMEGMGCSVTPTTVRSWMKSDDDSKATTPSSRAHFLAFAKALGIALPEEALLKMFDGIRRGRIGHRVSGRYLARAIRAAYLNRLNATILSRIQREWGMDVLHLMQTARVAEVDEVILPGGVANHAID